METSFGGKLNYEEWLIWRSNYFENENWMINTKSKTSNFLNNGTTTESFTGLRPICERMGRGSSR